MRTKDKLCTTKDLEVEKTISRILEENGYNGNPTTTWLPHATLDGLPLILPYVGEHPARAVNEVVKRSGLLAFRPSPTLKHLLTSTCIYEDKCPEVDCMYCTKEEKIRQLRGKRIPFGSKSQDLISARPLVLSDDDVIAES
ncbi:hypothetical protein Y032_0099g3184 [Ancylostoma ceylanicum]|uniref:Uncharacterized protein n=1 Tax=Ancylostoma ceylanicum TaxID=53326 RepID=A0A016TIV3_9BILA|nr:hypothetical protein Y032_0099g3184 [Ancylostoma ceylanicum]